MAGGAWELVYGGVLWAARARESTCRASPVASMEQQLLRLAAPSCDSQKHAFTRRHPPVQHCPLHAMQLSLSVRDCSTRDASHHCFLHDLRRSVTRSSCAVCCQPLRCRDTPKMRGNAYPFRLHPCQNTSVTSQPSRVYTTKITTIQLL